MKRYFLNFQFSNIHYRTVLLIFVCSILFQFNNQIMGQDSASTKTPVSMNVIYKKVDGVKTIKVQVSKKENGKNVSVQGPITNLYLNAVKKHNQPTGEGWIGNYSLDEEGEAVFELVEGLKYITDGKHEFTFIARMFSDPGYEDTEEEITIKDANIIITVSGEDSLKTVTAKLTQWGDSLTEVPVAEAELKLFIKRTFSLLPFGEEGLTTDENGEVSAQLPMDVIGEADGTLIIVAKVEEHEDFGTVQVSKTIPWTILPRANVENIRNLWSSGKNAPYSLVIASVSIIFVIWGTIIYLITLLFKIKKMGKEK